MDVVKAFNSELSSLYEVKPPISKAKMTSITKSAIKGIKFYKHIVQSVEKFIQKCRPEYKVPGLYVVDSIVRQSRHQFGADKDVFGPRFIKNITLTFQHLFKCVDEDRSRIIRVLNLWQKNNVFPIDIIQPLLDMGHPNTSNESAPTNDESRTSRHKEIDSSWKGWPQANDEPPPENRTYAEMSTKNLEKFTKAEMTSAIEDEVSRSSMFRAQIKQENLQEENTVKFNKKLLDFDYGDEEDEEEAKNEESHLSNQPNALALSMAQNLLCNPELLRKLQQMQQTIQQNALNSDLNLQGQHTIKQEPEEVPFSSEMPNSPAQPPLPSTTYQQPVLPSMELTQSEADKDDRVLPQPPLPPTDLDERSLAGIMTPHRLLPPASQQPGMSQADKDDRIIPDPTVPSRDLDERSLAAILAPLDRGMLPPMPFTEASTMMQYQAGIPYPPQQPPLPLGMEPMSMDAAYAPALPPEQQQHHLMQHAADEDERLMYSMPGEPPLPPQDFDERAIVPMEERSRKERSRSRSGSRTRRSGRHRSRSRSPRRKRSRSRSPRSKNRSRSKERERIREKERERERERERKKKGIPPIKKGYVSVCSTTLWMGHVPKSCTEVEISNAFGPYGSILSIDMIPPRGCAYVVMDRRQDAYKALQKLKNTKLLQSNSVKMAWAPGKGVKGKEYKDYWEVDAGVSYVPYEKIPTDPEALDLLEEGGFIDEESLPEHLKALRQQSDDKSAFDMHKMIPDTTTYNAMQAPPMVPPPIIPPTSVNVPMLLHPMQPQFGLHLPGLLPPQAMVMQVPMGIPPPNPMLMVQQQSQNMLGSQALPLVGGVPPLVQRTLPTIANALHNINKNTVTEPAISSTTGDATPTDEDGTSVPSPSTAQKSVPNSVTSTTVNSTQPGIPATQFNPMLNLPNNNRQILSVPPPVSTSGTPIPYPPPHNVGFNFPPPGMRPPGMAPNSQFPWMQKPPGSPFAESDSSQSRPVPGMPPHMFNNRPPFHEIPSSLPQNTPVKDGHSATRDNVERRPGDMEASGNRNPSPIHPDKMPQEMVISTDDESSMDRDYPHNEMTPGPRFPGMTEFPRMPMNMHRMRNPMGPMPGARFPPGMRMGSPFPPRMGGPRGMHPGHRMEMDFPPGPRGPRMSGMPPGPRRMDGPHHQNEGRDWYPRDFEGPPFERDMHFYDDRNRDSWTAPEGHEGDMRHPPRNQDRMRDMEKRDGYNHHGPDKQMMDDDFNSRQRQRPPRKSKPNDDSYEDMCRLNFYQRDKKSTYQYHPNKQSDQRRKDEIPSKSPYKNDLNRSTDQPNPDVNVQANNARIPAEKMDQESSIARRDREARKRSRWGRTLSEEREFQQQRRNEIEMKFQSYEQSAQAAQLLLRNSAEASSGEKPENSESDSKPPSNCDIADNPVPELTGTDSDSQNFASETSGSQQISEPASAIPASEPENPVLEPGVTTPAFQPDTVQSASEPNAVPSVLEPSVTNPFSEPFVTKLSELSDINPISEPSGTELSSEPLAADLLPEPSVSEPADSVRFSESISKLTCGSNFVEPVSNPNGMDTESDTAQRNETINPIDTNSSSPCDNDNDKSEISSTKTSPLLSAES